MTDITIESDDYKTREITRLRRELAECRDTLAKCTDQLTLSESVNDELRRHIATLGGELNEATAKISDLIRANKSLSRQVTYVASRPLYTGKGSYERIGSHEIGRDDQLVVTLSGRVTRIDPNGIGMEVQVGDLDLSIVVPDNVLTVAEISRERPSITEPEGVGVVVEAIDVLSENDWEQWISVEPVTQERRWYRVGSKNQDGLTPWTDFVATRWPMLRELDTDQLPAPGSTD